MMRAFQIFLVLVIATLFGAGCVPVEEIEPQETQQEPRAQLEIPSRPTALPDCVLPAEWTEIPPIFKDCQLHELERGSGYFQNFNLEDANGIFDYCNTLLFRHYSSVEGDLFTYEKIRYTHFPNSETGEYRMPEALYKTVTNSRLCLGIQNRFGDLDDDSLSAALFPSRNYQLGQELPYLNTLPTKVATDALISPAPPPILSPSPASEPTRYCCKTCSKGKACGNSCISRSYTCHQPPGCACDLN